MTTGCQHPTAAAAHLPRTVPPHDCRALGILDRRRRHVHRLLWPPARRHLAPAQAAFQRRDQGDRRPAVRRGSAIVDPARAADPAHFWRSWRLELLDAQGRVVGESVVEQSGEPAGCLTLATPLAVDPPPGSRYELSSPTEAPLVAIRYLLGLAPEEAVPPVRVRLGTTRGTNALLTRRGARVALVTTRGFGDVLAIGYQNRPRLFELAIHKPAPLAATSVEIDERVAADGTVLRVPDRAEIRRQLAELRDAGIESLAIALLHSVAQPAHEQLVAEIAREVGFDEISLSSEVAPLVKLVPRADTTTVDAYLNPVLRRYVAGLRQSLPGSELQILTSAGGLVAAERFAGKDSILSGPAGGVVGFSRVAQAAGAPRAIGFDMGGTSTDVSRFDGTFDLEYETEKAGVRVVAPMLAIETVAAGGGSICRFDGVKLVVGPDSAGADPGPACYGRGGPLTITDVNFYLGRIPAEHFPFVTFARGGRSAIAGDRRAIGGGRHSAGVGRFGRRICPIVECPHGQGHSLDFAGQGIRSARLSARSVRRRGGAARLRTGRRVANSPHPVPSRRRLVERLRHGLGRRHAASRRRNLSPVHGGCRRRFGNLLRRDGGRSPGRSRRRGSRVRSDRNPPHVGTALSRRRAIARDSCPLRERLRRHLRGRASQALRLRPRRPCAGDRRRAGGSARAIEHVAPRFAPRQPRARRRPPPSTPLYWSGRWHEAQVFTRQQLAPGDTIVGPALIAEASSTTVIDPGWRAEVLSQGELLLDRGRTSPDDRKTTTHRQQTVRAFDRRRPIRFCSRSSTIGWPASPTRWG